MLGNFTGVKFTHMGVTSEFFRRDGAFVVRTDGPDGQIGEFEVRHTFGVHPLQQYLLELPGGRLQALSIAWDTRPREAGGQRWFHLYPGERIDHQDELHWTKRQQNWNFMCADCHSTNLQKNYDAATDTYATRWSEISVGCEACHGPGSTHVRSSQARVAPADWPWRSTSAAARPGRSTLPRAMRGAARAARKLPRARRLRAMSFASRSVFERVPRGRAVPRPLPSGPAERGPLPSRRPAAGRGVRLGLVPVEPDACGRRDLQRLSRPPRGSAARAT